MYLPKPTEGGSFELAPAGTFTAICYRFLDRGTQISEFNGEKKTRREVMISWELCDELMTDGRPFTASKTYTWSMHEKATLRKDLEAWRGLGFTEADFDGGFNTKKLLGVPCTISITHTTRGDKTYANVSSIGKAMKGVQIPVLVNPRTYLALVPGEFDSAIFAGLSDKMREIIASSPEYKELMRKAERSDDPGYTHHIGIDPDDEIPF